MNIKDRKPQSLSRRKRLVFSMIIGVLVLVIIGFSAEAFTRLKGFAPLTPAANFISIEPPGKYFVKHPTRGYAYEPGEFTITQPGPHLFRVSHQSDGLRRTHPFNQDTRKDKEQIWIFGCSFTHGFSLNDEETYPWLLQQDLPDYEVINFGVDGYSTVQSLVQLKESLQSRKKPAIVVIAYSAALHDIRNRLTRLWKKALLSNSRLGPMNYPYAMLGPDKKLLMLNDPLDYPGLALMHYSALANYLDNQYNSSLEPSYDSHEVTRAVLREFWNLCKANGSQFVLAGIYNDPLTAEMLASFNAQGAMTVDISVNMRIKENTNLPYDAHPSAIADKQFAQKLEAFLQAKLIDKAKPQ